MKGKREKLLACSCCVAENKTYKEYLKQASKEIKESIDKELINDISQKTPRTIIKRNP